METGLFWTSIIIYIGAAFLMSLAGAFWWDDRQTLKQIKAARSEANGGAQ